MTSDFSETVRVKTCGELNSSHWQRKVCSLELYHRRVPFQGKGGIKTFFRRVKSQNNCLDSHFQNVKLVRRTVNSVGLKLSLQQSRRHFRKKEQTLKATVFYSCSQRQQLITYVYMDCNKWQKGYERWGEELELLCNFSVPQQWLRSRRFLKDSSGSVVNLTYKFQGTA